MKKTLELDRPLDDPSVRGTLRVGAQQNLIADLNSWFEFQRARNLTSHTYNEETAEEVYGVALKFPSFAHDLVQKISARP